MPDYAIQGKYQFIHRHFIYTEISGERLMRQRGLFCYCSLEMRLPKGGKAHVDLVAGKFVIAIPL
jgi:hypothetical protein